MAHEYGSEGKMRLFTSLPKTPKEDEPWLYVLDFLPIDGSEVLCYGNKTICCELDMEEAAEHKAIFRHKVISWKEDSNGNKFDVETYPCFEIDEEPYNLIFVSRWKYLHRDDFNSKQQNDDAKSNQ